MRRLRSLYIAISLALSPGAVLNAAVVEAPRFAAPSQPWISAFQAAGLPAVSPDAFAFLAEAAARSGLSPVQVQAQGPAARPAVEKAAAALGLELAPRIAPALAASRRLKARDLSDQELRRSAGVLRYVVDIAPYLPEREASQARAAYEPMRAEASARGLAENEAGILRTAANFDEKKDAAFAAVSRFPGSARLSRLSKAEPRPAELRTEPAAPPAGAEKRPSLRARAARTARLAVFTGMLVGLFHGRPPAVASDMDETATLSQSVMSASMAKAIADILRAGGRYGLLTGASYAGVERQVLEPLRRELGAEGAAVLERLTLGSRSGAQIHRYNPAADRFEAGEASGLEEHLSSEGIADGPARLRALIEKTQAEFGFEGGVIEDRVESGGKTTLTQMSFVAVSRGARLAEREFFAGGEGRRRRERYADYLNARLLEEGLPLEARVAGKTSIDFGVDKGYGLRRLARAMGERPERLIWAGDSHGRNGNDRPAAVLAGAVIDVGPRAELGRIVFREEDRGPAGLLPYYRILARYARVVQALRRRPA